MAQVSAWCPCGSTARWHVRVLFFPLALRVVAGWVRCVRPVAKCCEIVLTGHVRACIRCWVYPRCCPFPACGSGDGLLFWCEVCEQFGVDGGVGVEEDPLLRVFVWRRGDPVCPVYFKWRFS